MNLFVKSGLIFDLTVYVEDRLYQNAISMKTRDTNPRMSA